MIPLLPALFAATTVMQAGSLVMGGLASRAQGRAAREAAVIDAERYRIKRSLARSESIAQARMRWAEFRETDETNLAAIAMSNLSVNSFDDLRKAGRRKAGEDVSTIEQSGRIQANDYAAAAAQRLASGAAARSAGNISMITGMLRAGSVLAGAGMDYNMARRPRDPGFAELWRP